jgi:hypothetical protein
MTKRSGFLSAALLVFAIGGAHGALAAVKLTGAQETPPVTTDATGTASIKVSSDKTVTGHIKTKGIDGTMAHVHMGAPGQSGPPIITLTKASANEWKIPPDSKLSDDQYAAYKAGNLYVNVHSDAHKPGEIRAQLTP